MAWHVRPFTWLALLMGVSGLIYASLFEGVMGPAFLAFAHGLILLEFKKCTGRPQFVMVMLSCLAMGIVADLHMGTSGLMTLAMLLTATATVVRQTYMPKLTYVRYLWMEPLLLLSSAVLVILAWCHSGWHWDLLSLVLPFGAATLLAFGYVQDGILLKRKARFGYRVQAGMEAPDFVLPDQEGNSVRLSEHRGRHPLLLIFVRGDWCPGCHMMLRTYERQRERFMERNVHVMAIGPDAIEVNKEMAARIGVGYQLLSDGEQVVSQRYGVVYSNPVLEQGIDYAAGIPLPASFLIDDQGVVRYVSRPDRVGEFLDPSLIFNVLGQLPRRGEHSWKAA